MLNADRTGVIRRTLVGDDLVQLARPGLGALSDTAAVAADTASDAPNCGSLSDSGVFSLGSSTSTSPSQNAMRSKKNISRPLPSLLIPLRCLATVAVDLAISP